MRRSRIVLALAATAVCAAGCATSSPGHGTGAGAVPPPSSASSAASSASQPAPATPAPSSRTSSAPHAPPSTGPSTSTPPARTIHPSPPPASHTPGPAGASRYTGRGGPNSWCGSSQVAVTGHAPSHGDVAGHTGVELQFLNTSHQACILYGYPGADGLDGGGHTVAHAARTTGGYLGGCGCTQPRGVLVKPGQSAYAIVEGDSGGSGSCDRFRSLLVTPPNTYRSTPIAMAPHSCDFQVHPVVPEDAGPQ